MATDIDRPECSWMWLDHAFFDGLFGDESPPQTEPLEAEPVEVEDSPPPDRAVHVESSVDEDLNVGGIEDFGGLEGPSDEPTDLDRILANEAPEEFHEAAAPAFPDNADVDVLVVAARCAGFLQRLEAAAACITEMIQ